MTTLATTNGVATNDNGASKPSTAISRGSGLGTAGCTDRKLVDRLQDPEFAHAEWERSNRLDRLESMHDGLVAGLIGLAEQIVPEINDEDTDHLRPLGRRLKVILWALDSCDAQFIHEDASLLPSRRRHDREEYTRAIVECAAGRRVDQNGP